MSASRRSRLGIRAGLVLSVAAVSACGSDPDPAPQEAVTSVATPTSTSVATTTVAPTTTVSPIPAEHVASCVENAKFQAFTGNEFWSAMWTDAGATDGGMRAVCEFLGDDDPAMLAQIHQDWQTLLAAAETGSDTGTDQATVETTAEQEVEPAPGAPDPGLVAACVDWYEYHRLIGEPSAVDLYENLGGSLTALRDVCRGIARDNPTEAERMRDELPDLP